MRKKMTILGSQIDHVDKQQTLQIIGQFIDSDKAHHIITANAEIVYQARNDDKRRQVINSADLVTADGAGIVWASKYLGQPLQERVTGIDLVDDICRISEEKGWRLYFVGAKQEVIERAVLNLLAKYPQCQIVGYHNGYFSKDEEKEIVEEIKAAKPDVLFAAMGVPKQDDWIIAHQETLKVPVAIGIGGCLDVISGNLKRAPKWMQKLGLEWLYRLLLQPSRIGRMMALPKFVLAVRKERKR